MLKATHTPDLNFKTASPFLKRILNKYFKNVGERCLDLPCGNGRNIFLLSQHFKMVTGIDKELAYLEAIRSAMPLYKDVPHNLEQRDVLKNKIKGISAYDLICNIQFYDESLISLLIDNMKKGAFLLLETPGCRGGNFLELPTDEDLKALIKGNEVLKYNFNVCSHKDNETATGSAQFLIKKL